jgi:hypothetical protein
MPITIRIVILMKEPASSYDLKMYGEMDLMFTTWFALYAFWKLTEKEYLEI